MPSSAAMKESVKGSLIDLKSSAQAATSSLRRISVNMHYPFSKDTNRPNSSATDNILQDDDVWAANISDEEESEKKDNHDVNCTSSSVAIGTAVVVTHPCVMAVTSSPTAPPVPTEMTSPNQRHRTSSIKSLHFSDDEDSSDDDDEASRITIPGTQTIVSSPTRRHHTTENDNMTSQPLSQPSDVNGVVEEEMDTSQRTWRSRTSQDPNAASDEQPVVNATADKMSIDLPTKISVGEQFGLIDTSNGERSVDSPTSAMPAKNDTHSHNPSTDTTNPDNPTRYVRTNTLAMQSDLSQAFARATQKGRAMAAIHR